MSGQSTEDLDKFLLLFPLEIREKTYWLRDFVLSTYPDAVELIYNNHNALAIAFSSSEKSSTAFCSIAVYQKQVNFGFNFGLEISDPKGLLEGDGTQFRKITVDDKADFPKVYIKKLMAEAYQNSTLKITQSRQLVRRKPTTRSASPAKRHPKR